MLDLKAIQAKIDNLWEKETPDSLTNWLFQKRLSDINTIIGEGKFVSIQTKSIVAKFTSPEIGQTFATNEGDEFDPTPPYRQAA